MDVEEGTSNSDALECSEGLRRLKSEVVNNVDRFGIGKNDLAGWSSMKTEVLRTYKRRKHVKSSSESKSDDEGRIYAKDEGQMSRKLLKEPQGADNNPNPCKKIRLPTNSLDGLQRPWKIVFEHMCLSLGDDESGMQRCIRDMLESCADIGSISKAKEHDHLDENRQACTSPPRNLLNRFQKGNSGNPDELANGHFENLSQDTVADKCRYVWFNILVSEKFMSLSTLLSKNFHGIKTDSFFDLKLINSRMKEGTYENSPMLFLTDIQQVWEKIQKIGTEMISLAKSLSDISSSCHSEQFCSWESDSQTKREQAEDYSSYRACPCQRCGDKADGRDCLVCDSCEEMYHVSCIEPAVEEIPPISWYCGSCSPRGTRSPHEDCVVCQRLNAPKSAVKKAGNNTPCTKETHKEHGENSNFATDEEGFQLPKSSKSLSLCKSCKSEIQDGEKSKTCSNKYCPSRYYHVRCLDGKQLRSYGPGWYCPSCLCRSCLTDKDDDKIVLCDGCDHAYHIYCTKPELASIPEGKWFCRSCDAKLHEIRREKKAYENKQKKKDSEKMWNRKGCMEQDNGGGIDMLLTAVHSLHDQEKQAR